MVRHHCRLGLPRPAGHRHRCAFRRRGSIVVGGPSLLQILMLILCLWLPILDNGGGLVLACGPGRGAGRNHKFWKLTPLVFKQHVPNVSENTLPASGLSEGRVSRHDARFRDLVPNYNTDIIFKDEEGTGADRLMTQRCKEKLNTLAISVMNQWPGVKLRVTEGWDEEGKHATDSLHYEGRAVDVTTSDRDRSKYGMLARLAVEAGFDWVYYESRSHIHCSVKSESSSVGKSGGCFTGRSYVRTEDGNKKRLDEVKIGDRIGTIDSRTNEVFYSKVIAFLDRQPKEKRQFIRLTTESGRSLTLTPAHLVPIADGSMIFAMRVKNGDHILVMDEKEEEEEEEQTQMEAAKPVETSVSTSVELEKTRKEQMFTSKERIFMKEKETMEQRRRGRRRGFHRLYWDKVVETTLILEEGVFAPLTVAGTLLVDDVFVSCYAVVWSQTLAHYSFLPLRIWNNVESFFMQRLSSEGKAITSTSRFTDRVERQNSEKNALETTSQMGGVHWYASMLYTVATYILPTNMLYN